MAKNEVYSNLNLLGSAHITGATAIYVTQDATDNNQLVTLQQLSLKQDVLVANDIDDTLIDFGTGVNQVNADDIPVIDTEGNFTGATIEEALQELYNREQNVTIIEFSSAEILENREGLVAYVVPELYNGKRITGYFAKVITKNDNVTLQLNNNGVIITNSSAIITTSAGVNSSALNETLTTGDIIQVETTAVGITQSLGLVVNIKIEA